ncbi:helix-turn-helix transcriptional regulator [Paenibacillus alginolyticus]|uniref:helix-turn-helix transcriptional regulator n=1 Tax=Paenibacillus alginolyticus TaxID=59839 RepID=UPI001FE5EFFE|nr:AAA family ATPase [Paenibacillus frigoriresistens]
MERVKVSLLRDYLHDGQLHLPDIISMAIQITEQLEALHGENLVSARLSPETIEVEAGTFQVQVINERLTDQTELNPAYMSPEQSGRMNRGVDSRSDLYSLGLILYEMLTGKLPYVAEHLVAWTHAHLAVAPVHPHTYRPELPEPLCRMVQRLLEKDPDQRYQTASGLRADLTQCLEQWRRTGAILDFELGREDARGTFQIQEQLYGREKETSELLDAFGCACLGSNELVLISGPPGIGKTALVDSALRTIAVGKAYWISGKCDQYQRNTPYGTMIAAFGQLVSQLLTEPHEVLTRLRDRFLQSAGNAASVVLEVLPDLKTAIGTLPPAEKLPPAEAGRRLEHAIRGLIQSVAKERPLVLFLDDLQWSDRASRQLLQTLLTDPASQNLLVIGAYRDTEADPRSFLGSLYDYEASHGITIRTLQLSPLEIDVFHRMVADTLQLDKQQGVELAEALFAKSAGNPFYFKRLFQEMKDREWLTFRGTRGSWDWMLERLEELPGIEQVVDYLVHKIQSLPDTTRQLLVLASCLGSHPKLEDLSLLSGATPEQAINELAPAVQEGLLLPVKQNGGDIEAYRFYHDRIQQAAYSLLDSNLRSRSLLELGRAIYERETATERWDRIYDLADYYNAGSEHITASEEKVRRAEMNLLAGDKAKEASAYASALHYYRHALEGEDPARTNELFQLRMNLAECEYLSGSFDTAERLCCELLGQAKRFEDRAQVYRIQMNQLSSSGKYAEAITLGLRGLKEAGIRIPEKPNTLRILREVMTARWQVSKQIDKLHLLQEVQDSQIQAVMDLMFALVAPTFFINKPVYAVLTSYFVRLSLQHGISRYAPTFYVAFGILLGAAMQQYRLGYEIGKAAVSLADVLKIPSVQCQTYTMFGGVLCQWVGQTREGDPYLEEALKLGLQSGDHMYASYAIGAHINAAYVKESMDGMLELNKSYLAPLEITKDDLVTKNVHIFIQLAKTLKGLTGDVFQLHDGFSNEDDFLASVDQDDGKAITLFQFYTYKLQICYLFGRYSEALRYAELAAPYRVNSMHSPHAPQFGFYAALAVCGGWSGLSSQARRRWWKQAKRYAKHLKQLAAEGPNHYAARSQLVEAEMCRVRGKHALAADCYESAIHMAKQHGSPEQEAVGNELAGKFYNDHGKKKIAALYRKDAHDGYLQWGAVAKAEHIAREDDERMQVTVETTDEPANAPEPTPGTEHASRQLGKEIDLFTLMKASQTMTEGLELDQLFRQLMKLILETSGAHRACLLVEWNGQLVKGTDLSNTAYACYSPGTGYGAKELPLTIFQWVERTKGTVSYNGEMRESPFFHDAYWADRPCLSVLAMPVCVKETLCGVLYVESRLTAHVFQPQGSKVLEVLASQAVYVYRLLYPFGESAEAAQPSAPDHLQRERNRNLIEPLTEREMEILNLMSTGMTNREIAQKLGLAVGTTKVHVHNILGKMNVNRRTKAVAQAKELQLLNDNNR